MLVNIKKIHLPILTQ